MGARRLGTLASSAHLQVDVSLSPRDPAALSQFATAVSTPGNTLYRHFIGLKAFVARFGPTPGAISAVERVLRADGLRPGAITANHLIIPVNATASAFGTAFKTGFDTYRMPTGRTAYANVAAPYLGAAARYVEGVVGLNNLYLPHRLGIVAAHKAHVVRPKAAVSPCSAASSAGSTYSAYTSNQIDSAYNFTGLDNAGDTGAGTTVAIFELEPNIHSDITAFESCYGISTAVNYIAEDGGPTGTAPGSDQAGVETELDIENIIGVAPGVTVDVYQAPNSDAGLIDNYTAIVENSAVKVVSTSWGECESESGSSIISEENTLFEEGATAGQSIFAAAGDAGSNDCDSTSGQLGVDDPASQPYVTGVGGTSLTSTTAPPTETVWNDGGSNGAGGGGISLSHAMPSYQSGAASSVNVINSNSSGTPCGAASGSYCREVPDVTASADENHGYVEYWDGQWTAVGGTSGAAPTWAAFAALTDASSGCGGKAIGFANPGLYAAAGSSYSTNFYDVTSGNNDYAGTTKYPAGTGYDMASGLGAPNASNLAATLCGGTVSNTVTVTNPGSQTSTVGTAVSLQIQASDSASGQTLTYSATGLPAGLSISSSSGLISGTPTTAGTSSVTVTAKDTTGASGSATFSWTVNPVAANTVTVTNPGSQTSTVGTAVSLQIQASDSASGQTLTYSATGLPAGLSISSSSGLISGTPTTAGTSSVTVTAKDTTGASGSATFSWTVNPVAANTVTVTNPGSQTSTVGTAVSLQIQASDSASGQTLTYSATGLPAGLSISSSSGLISGTPTTAGTSSVTVTAKDTTGASGSATFSWTVNPVAANTVTVTNPGSQTSTVGTAVSLQIQASDSASGQTLTYSATGLPAGLSISSSSGLISGTPTTAGTSSVTVTAKDTTGASGSATFSWTVNPVAANTVTVTNPGSQTSTVGTAVSLQIQASDSASGQTLTYSATGLPAGLSISSSSGLISGTPTTAGTSSVTVTAKDTTGASGSATFSWTVNPTSSCTSSQLLLNPGFESGNVDWTTTPNVIENNRETSPYEVAEAGSWFAWLDGYGTPHTDTLAQTVTVPSGCTSVTLSYYQHIDTSERSGSCAGCDTLTLQVLNSSGKVLGTLSTYTNLNAASGYQHISTSLAAYVGQKITIKWTGVETDKGRGTTDFLIDTTALNVSSSGSGVLPFDHARHARGSATSASDSMLSAVDLKVVAPRWLRVLFLGMRAIV